MQSQDFVGLFKPKRDKFRTIGSITTTSHSPFLYRTTFLFILLWLSPYTMSMTPKTKLIHAYASEWLDTPEGINSRSGCWMLVEIYTWKYVMVVYDLIKKITNNHLRLSQIVLDILCTFKS